MALKIPFGLHSESGRLVHVDRVPNGKACRCVCPSCRMPLVAKNQGRQQAHHFAHSSDSNSAACEGWLHATAKYALYQRIQDALSKPEPIPISWYCFICGCSHKGDLLKKVNGARLEKMIPDADARIIPDITLLADETPRTFIEIVDSHHPEANTLEIAESKGCSLLVFEVHDADGLDNLLSDTLNPKALHVQCFCKLCEHCKSVRLCPNKKHTYCERCFSCYNKSSQQHAYCSLCKSCITINLDFHESHRHCRDCKDILWDSRYPTCFCCHIAKKFNIPTCNSQQRATKHRHCKDCGKYNTRKNRDGLLYELCYACYNDGMNREEVAYQQELDAQQAERRTETDDFQRVSAVRQPEPNEHQLERQKEEEERRRKDEEAWRQLSEELQASVLKHSQVPGQ